jgi:hypothetical protein
MGLIRRAAAFAATGAVILVFALSALHVVNSLPPPVTRLGLGEEFFMHCGPQYYAKGSLPPDCPSGQNYTPPEVSHRPYDPTP